MAVVPLAGEEPDPEPDALPELPGARALYDG